MSILDSFMIERYGMEDSQKEQAIRDQTNPRFGHEVERCTSQSFWNASRKNFTHETFQEKGKTDSCNSMSVSDDDIMDGQVKINESISPSFRSLFPFKFFNKMQSLCFESTYKENTNLVISAPTGSGKTVIFEIAMAKMFEINNDKIPCKAVYIAPLKSLVNEKYRDWQMKFSKIGKRVTELTGDTVLNTAELTGADIIVATPEKIDSMTRRWKSNKVFMDSIGLLMIDEVHIIGENRGACLEGLVTRCKMRKKFKFDNSDSCAARNMRFIAVSATVPNIEDIATWLDAKMLTFMIFYHGTKETLTLIDFGIRLVFGNEFRPVPLEHIVIGRKPNRKGNQFLFDKNLNYILFDTIKKYSAGLPTLVFCSTRKGCEDAANSILSQMQSEGYDRGFVDSAEERILLRRLCKNVKAKTLRELIPYGIAVHTAGIEVSDRRLAEELFSKGRIQVMCATTTLAQGVNLPAHLVVVKSTKRYIRSEGWIEYSKQDILQMIGRAGRPQFDNTGVAVIMTEDKNVQCYENLLNGHIPLESNLRHNIIDHLNAEIVTGTVENVKDATIWIKSTFLAERITRNPKHYGMNTKKVKDILENIVRKDLQRLIKTELATTKKSGSIRSTQLGRLMSKFYLRYETVESISSIGSRIEVPTLLRLVAQAEEYKQNLRIRMGEKGWLNGCNKGSKKKSTSERYKRIRYPMKGKVKAIEDKIYILTQIALSGEKIENWDLKMDVESIFKVGSRILNCVSEFLLSKSKSFESAKSSLLLRKSFRMKMWFDEKRRQLQQLTNIGPKLCTLLADSNISTLRDLESAGVLRIEDAVNRKPPFGTQLKAKLKYLPLFGVKSYLLPTNNSIEWNLHIEVLQERPNLQSNIHYVHLLVGNQNNIILLHRRFKSSSTGCTFRKTVNRNESVSEAFEINIIYEDIVGYDILESFVHFPESKILSQESDSTRHSSSKHKKTLIQSRLDIPAIPMSNSILRTDDFADPELSSWSDDSVLPNFMLDKRGSSQLYSNTVRYDQKIHHLNNLEHERANYYQNESASVNERDSLEKLESLDGYIFKTNKQQTNVNDKHNKAGMLALKNLEGNLSKIENVTKTPLKLPRGKRKGRKIKRNMDYYPLTHKRSKTKSSNDEIKNENWYHVPQKESNSRNSSNSKIFKHSEIGSQKEESKLAENLKPSGLASSYTSLFTDLF